MERRFDSINQDLVRAIQALVPSSNRFFEFEVIEPLIAHYSLDSADQYHFIYSHHRKLQQELPLAMPVVSAGYWWER